MAMRCGIGRLRTENLELRRKMLDAAECACFYASGAIDSGARANRVLRRLAMGFGQPSAVATAREGNVLSGKRVE
jgi:hypothetical protein